MQDSDDYFDDNFTLTEKDLEAIDEAQSRYLARTHHHNNASQPSGVRHTPPPAKRQKTNHVWNQTPSQASGSGGDFGEMPEITVQGDGSYAVYGERGSRGVNSGPGIVNRPRVAPRQLSKTPSAQGQIISSAQANRPRPQPVSRASSSGSGAVGQRGRSPAVDQSRRSTTPILSRRPSGAQMVNRTGSVTDKEGHGLQELRTLRAQLTQVTKEKEDALKAAKEAQDAQFAKLGEASILRSNMERVKQQHASEVTRLKAAIEAAEAEQAQIKRTMKDELERMRTQNMFRQHELETTHRTPWMSRTRKIDQQRPSSPVPLPSQIRQWNSAASKAMQTPRKPTLVISGSPERSRRNEPPPKRAVKLPGFQNAFEHSPPVKAKGKGKQRETRLEDDNSVFFVSGGPPSSPTPGPALPLRDGKGTDNDPDVHMEEIAQVQPQGDNSLTPTANNDVAMANETMHLTPNPDEPPAIEPLNLKDEVHEIVTSHLFTVDNNHKSFTIQLLLNLPASAGDPPPPSAQVDHSTACGQLIETLWATSKIIDEDTYISAVSESLVLLVGAFNAISFIPTLSALFSLLQVLSYCVTPFTTKLLTPPPNDDQFRAPLVAALCSVILDQLNPDKGYAENILRPFVKELFGLIGTMSYLAKDDLVTSLGLIPRSREVLATLLSSRQPLWLIQRATKTLALLVSHTELCRDFLTVPDAPLEEQGKGSKDHPSIPHIEQMSRYLRDGRETPDVLEFKSNILSFIGMLSIAHRDSLTLLVQSQTLVPSIIIFLADVSNAFWEEREDLLCSPELVTKHIEIMASTTLLLHHMMCSSPSRYDVARLFPLSVKNSKFNGLVHKCTVTFSRLAFADPPDWIDSVQKEQLEQIPDMAKELLQLFHDDPEMEVLWSTFQLDPDMVRRAPADEDEEAMLGVPDGDE